MKKLYFLITTATLLLLMSIGKLNAVEVTIGTGTVQTSYPFNTLYEDARTEILYTAAEITAAGGSAGNITSLSFNVADNANVPMNGLQIKIKSTIATTLTGFTTTGWTTVYNATTSLTSNGWREFIFTTPFAWDGSSNIAVQICFNNDDWEDWSFVFSTAIANMTWYEFTDGEDGCALSSGGDEDNRPNIKFNIGVTAPMTYTSFDTLQVTSNAIARNSQNQLVGAVNINTTGTSSPYFIKRIVFSNAGTATSADVENVKVWLNNSLVLNTDPTKLYGSNSIINTGLNTVTRTVGAPNMELSAGLNVLFFTYDAKSTATIGHIADLKIDTIVLAKGTVETPVIVNTNTFGSRTIKDPLIGEYLIGGPVQATRYYPTLQSAIEDLSGLGISGDVDFAIAGNLTLPTDVPVNLLQFNNTGNHNVTIYPKSAPSIITGDYTGNGSMFTIAGADRVTIDGRVNKTGTERGLTIKNNSADTNARIMLIIGDNASNGGADDITIKYVNFDATNKTAYLSRAIFISGTGNDNNTIEFCKFTKFDYALQVSASDGATIPAANNLKINDNIFGDEVLANSINRLAGYFRNIHQFEFNRNIVQNIIHPTDYVVPIYLDQDIQNARISQNKISNIAGSTFSMVVYSYNANNQNIQVDNNIIYQFYGKNTTYGFYLIGATNFDIYHNTVIMEGNRDEVQPGSPAGTMSALVYTGANVSGVNIKNNIFVNNLTTGTTQNTYMIYSTNNTAIVESDYNNFYLIGSNPIFASFGGTVSNTLANWQPSSTFDANSKSILVDFTEDKHLSGSAAFLSDLLVPVLDIPLLVNDIDNLPRHSFPGTTQMGADDVSPLLAITQDLSDEISGLCAPTEQILTVQTAVTGFTDGIERTIVNPPFTYNWKLNGTPVDNVQYSLNDDGELEATTVNSNVFTVRLEEATPAEGINYNVEVVSVGGSVISNTTNIKSEQNVVITEPLMETAELCTENGKSTLRIGTTGTVSGYQWQKEIDGVWTNLLGETNDSVVVILADPQFGPGSYRVLIYDGENNCNNGQVISNVSVLNAVDPLRNLVLFSPDLVENNIEVCEASNTTLLVNKDLLTGDIFGFRWEEFKDGAWSVVDLAKHPEMSIDGIDFSKALPEHSGIFRLVLIGSSLCDTKELASDSINILIKPFVKILNQPTAQILCKNNAIVLEVKAEGEGATYQWTKDGKPITAEENSTFDKPVFVIENATFDDSGVYGVLVKVIGCVPGRDDGVLVSDPATIYVMNETQIVSQPTNQHAILGKKAIFEVRTNAIGAAPDYVAEFQWFKGNAELRDDAKYAGAKSSILIIKNTDASDATAEYYLRIKGLCGDYIYTERVHVIPATVAFTQQLADASACEGDSYKFSVLAETTYPNDELTYEWHFIDVNGVDAVLPSSTSNELSVIATPATSGTYYVLARLLQDGSSVKSNEAVFTVNSIPVITEPFAATTKATNESFTLTVLASGNNLEYKWYRDGALIANAVSSSYTGQEANPGTYAYTVEVLNGCGLVSTSANVTITAGPKVDVIEPIMGVTVSNVVPNPVVSHTASFSVTSDRAYPMTVSLIDAAGRNYGTLFDGVLSSSQDIIFNVTDLSSGAYYLNININGKVITRQIIVNK